MKNRMIVSRTPLRVSLFGGGTDYPEWFTLPGKTGAVLSVAIDKYIYVTVRISPSDKHRFVWRFMEDVYRHQDSLNPAISGVLDGYKDQLKGRKLEIHYQSDLPGRSGLGSSSSFVVGLLKALDTLFEDQDVINEREAQGEDGLARRAIYIERDIIGDCVGCQDQFAAAFGGVNVFSFDNNQMGHKIIRRRLNSQLCSALLSHLYLFDTGIRRSASSIASNVVDGIGDKVKCFGTVEGMVYEAVKCIAASDPSSVGELLNDAWTLKRKSGDGVTNEHIDSLYERAMIAGASGGKIVGAGGGGFMLLYIPDNKKVDFVADIFPDKKAIPVRHSSYGSIAVNPFKSREPEFEGIGDLVRSNMGEFPDFLSG